MIDTLDGDVISSHMGGSSHHHYLCTSNIGQSNVRKQMLIQDMQLPMGAAIKEIFGNEITGQQSRTGIGKLPKLPRDLQMGISRNLHLFFGFFSANLTIILT